MQEFVHAGSFNLSGEGESSCSTSSTQARSTPTWTVVVTNTTFWIVSKTRSRVPTQRVNCLY